MKVIAQPDRTRILLIAFVLILLPLCFLGYGTDNDTYMVLEAGRHTYQQHDTITSRSPGYWVFEAIIYVLNNLGGFLATNLATLAIATVVLWRFLVIAGRMGLRFPVLAAASLVAIPVYASACTSTEDFIWSLLGLVLFAELLLADRLVLAILPAAFAFAIRGANGVIIAGAIAGALAIPVACRHRLSKHSLQVIGVGCAAAILGGLPYIESYRYWGDSFGFVHGLIGNPEMWSVKMRVGRFVYKTFYLFGPIACAVLGAGALAFAKKKTAALPEPAAVASYRAAAIPLFLGMVIANLLLYLKYPIEISYLIPAAFFGMLLLGISVLARSQALSALFLLAILTLDLVNPQLVAPNIPGRATDASLHPSLQQGVMVGDVRLRLLLRNCSGYICYYDTLHPGPAPVDPSQ